MANEKDRGADRDASQIVSMTAEQFQQFLAAAKGMGKDELKEILTSVQQQGADGMKRALRPENDRHPGISACSYPEGEVKRPKPRLKRTTFLCGRRVSEEELTPQEIEALNAFDKTREARGGDWKAEVKKNGTHEELRVWFPCNSIDARMDLPPSLLHILAELKDGPAAVDFAQLQARLKELEQLIEVAG